MTDIRWVRPVTSTHGHARFEDGSVIGVLAGALYLRGPGGRRVEDAPDTVPAMVALGAEDPALLTFDLAHRTLAAVPDLDPEDTIRAAMEHTIGGGPSGFDARSRTSRAIAAHCGGAKERGPRCAEWAGRWLRDEPWECAALDRIARGSDGGAVLAVAGNEHTPVDTATFLAQIGHELVSEALAKRQSLPDEAFAALHASGDLDVLHTLARRSTRPDRLALLATHSSPSVRGTVGRNVMCPLATLAVLCTDKDPLVRVEVMMRLDREGTAREALAARS